MLGLYLFGIGIIIVLARNCFFKKNTEKNKKCLFVIAFVLLVLLLGCRNAQYDYGSDLNNYYRAFERAIASTNLKKFISENYMEQGYLCLNWIMARFIKWPQFIVFFQAAFCCGLTLRYIYKHSTDMMMSIIGFLSLGLFQIYLTGFRQSMAISICLVAFEKAEEKKFFRFILYVILATMIHQTAIVYLVVYLLTNIRVSKLSIICSLGVIFVVWQFVPEIVQLGNTLFEKEYEGTFVGNSTGGLINVFIGVAIIALMAYRIRSLNRSNLGRGIMYKKDRIDQNAYYPNFRMFHSLFLGTGIYALRYQALILERISYYFIPTMFILLPEVIRKGFAKRDTKILRIAATIGMLFLTYWRSRNTEYIAFWE